MFDRASGSAFITLTYDSDHLPEGWSLCKRDFQLFMKSLRKRLNRAPGNGVRFFMCGEYGLMCRHGLATDINDIGIDICFGCNVGRPHFHAILFNITFPNKVAIGRGQDDVIYTDDILISSWKRGFVSIGNVTMQSAGYVARYAVKKITGKMADSHYVVCDDDGVLISVNPEFSTMSNRPGIGAKWFDKYQTDVFPSDEVPVPGEGVFKKVPGYYQLLMERVDPAIIEEVKIERLNYLKSHKDEFTPDRLMSKYKVKKSQVNNLKRKLL